MLVLSIKKGQHIVIHNDKGLYVDVSISDICDNKVRLGFSASKDVVIDREKIYRQKKGFANGTLSDHSSSPL